MNKYERQLKYSEWYHAMNPFKIIVEREDRTMKKKLTSASKKNGVAKALRTPKYKMQVIPDKRQKTLVNRLTKYLKDFFGGK